MIAPAVVVNLHDFEPALGPPPARAKHRP
jgi:hypothetical protein